jgi:N-acyl homoserine lactone hydrolase
MIELSGRPKRLAVLDYGLFKVKENGRVIGICGYFIETDAGERVLIDTGFPAKYAQDADAATTEDSLGDFGEVMECTPENLPYAQLRKLGLRRADIDLLIISHTHIDHIGDMHGFPSAPILMAAAERNLPRPLYWRGAQPMEWPTRDYHLVDADMALGPGFQVFLTPGHAPGQLAFMVDLPETGAVLLTSDAISRPSEIEERFEGSWDAPAALENAQRLMRAAEDRDALVIYGHSPEQWPTLRKAPETYT